MMSVSRSFTIPFILLLILFFCSFNAGAENAYGHDQAINVSSHGAAETNNSQVIDKLGNAINNDGGTSKAGTEANLDSENTENSKEIATEKEHEKERDIMEEALELLDESRSYWIKGDIENALDMLDQAYALLLDTNGDPDIARQKDDLRLLISKRILAIYSSLHTTTQGKRSEIPYVLNSDVEKEIRLFQTVERDFFIQSYKRSGLYRSIIQRELKKTGLPEELSWLPLVESGFKTHALSTARALGMWQFIPSTGYKYGLNRDEWIDERLDVEKSTRAAIEYLKELHGMFGDWLTVLAAYNCGEGRVLKVISRQHINYLDRFWDLYNQLPKETARYVPRFLATLLIIKDPKKYNMNLEKNLDHPYAYETVKTSKSMKIQDIALHVGISEDILNALNPELRLKITPDKEYNLKVPLEAAEKLVKVADEIPRWEKPRKSFVKHRVKRGETVASIARKYRASIDDILSCNNLSSKKRFKVGQRLNIPVNGSGSGYAKAKASKQTDTGNAHSNDDVIKYKVKKGDTLASIAKRHGTTSNEIQKLNKLKKKAIKPGQVILLSGGNGSQVDGNQNVIVTKKVSKTPSKEPKTYTVKKGDSLNKIAKENGVSIDKLLEVNKFAREDKLQPGQVILVR